MSMMHSRIKYPKETQDKTRDEEVRKQARDLERPSEHGHSHHGQAPSGKVPVRNSTAA
jgi:hypothetical protein